MKVGDLVKWRDPIGTCQTHVVPLYGLIVKRLTTGWVNVYWFNDTVPDNPTKEPLMHLELLNESW